MQDFFSRYKLSMLIMYTYHSWFFILYWFCFFARFEQKSSLKTHILIAVSSFLLHFFLSRHLCVFFLFSLLHHSSLVLSPTNISLLVSLSIPLSCSLLLLPSLSGPAVLLHYHQETRGRGGEWRSNRPMDG